MINFIYNIFCATLAMSVSGGSPDNYKHRNTKKFSVINLPLVFELTSEDTC